MKGKKATKRALLSSALSLVLCFSMLLGTTFAWFTDTATTSVNVIKSGTLNVDLEDEAGNSLEGKALSFVNKNGSADILWEPGVTFQTEKFKVANNGNLDLKYQIVVNGINVSDNKLMEVIDFKIVNATATTDAANPVKVDFNKEADYTLLAETDSDLMYIEAHMNEKAGNEYQDLTCSGISIVVYATQLNSEYDSNGNTYDKNAVYDKAVIIKTVDEFVEFFANLKDGDSAILGADIDMTGMSWTGVNNISFSLNGSGYTISNLKNVSVGTKAGGLVNTIGSGKPITIKNLVLDGMVVEAQGADSNGFSFAGGVVAYADAGDVTVENVTVKNSTIKSENYAGGIFGWNAGYGVDSDGPVNSLYTTKNCTVIGSTITGGGSAAAAVGHAGANDATTNNITDFTAIGNTITGENGKKTGLVVGTANVGVVNIKGATLTANTLGHASEECEDTNESVVTGVVGRFVPGTTGKLYVSDVTIKTGTYVSENVSTPAELTAAINSGDIVDVELAAGTYTLPDTNGKEVTISGTVDTVIDTTAGYYADSADLTFNGVTINCDMTGNGVGDYECIYSPNARFINCVINGEHGIGRDGAYYEGCTFNLPEGKYVWTYANDVTFKNCTFNTSGKALLCYNHGGNEMVNVKIEGCTFNATAGAKAGAIANQNCAAVEIDNYGCSFNITFSGTNTYNTEHFSGLWRIKSFYSNNNTVMVNGDAYTTIAIDGKTMAIDADKNVTVNE